MSAALALSQTTTVAAPAKDVRPVLNLVHVAEQPSAQLAAKRLTKRVAVRSRLSSLVEAGSSLALFHAYRP